MELSQNFFEMRIIFFPRITKFLHAVICAPAIIAWSPVDDHSGMAMHNLPFWNGIV